MVRKAFLLTMFLTVLLALAACTTPAVVPTTIIVPTTQRPSDVTSLATATTAPVAQPTETALPDMVQVNTTSGETTIDSAALAATIAPLPSGELNAEEVAGLQFMREEEKLAHDVYLFLFDKWGLNTFQNIANSEQTHTDSVKILLDRYGLSDPAAATTPGQFTNSTLQNLYDQLTAQGSQSLADAIKVGAAIEEIDILDLQKQAALTTLEDILLVYANLEKGSRNHLRSFVNVLQSKAGETYQAQYLSVDAYQAIVGTAIESGGNGRGGNRP
jgi:hypothetical protein